MWIYNIFFLIASVAIVASRPQNDEQSLGITNGTEPAPHSIPYQVLIQLTLQERARWCTGTLINFRYVLTAAHCVADADFGVAYLGVHKFNETDLGLIIYVREFIVHEKYDNETLNNDIALVDTKFIFEPSNVVQSVELPTESFDSADYVGRSGRISGWGLTRINGNRSNIILEANSTIVENSECTTAYGVKENILCLSGQEGGSPCDGDDGAPLVVDQIQIGLVSKGSCANGLPSVIVNVGNYLDWINSKLE